MSQLSPMARLTGCALALFLAACASTPPARWPTPAPIAQPIRYEASFNCNSPQTPVQLLICENEALAALDRDMAHAFRSDIRMLDLFGRTQLVADQRRWLLRRSAQCRVPDTRGGALAPAAAECLKNMYRARIAELVAWPKPQARQRPGWHPLSAYVEFKRVDDREPALCGELEKQFNDAIAARGQVDPSRIAGFTELAGSHGPASSVRDGRKIDVLLYDAGSYASYQLRAKGLAINGQSRLNENSLPDWIVQLPNSGGRFNASASQTADYAAIDAFLAKGREFVLVSETWGYYTSAARGESPHAGVFELVQGQDLQRRCLYRTYLTPPIARIFERLPVFKELTDVLHAMSGDLPPGLAPDERLDETLLERELQWMLFNMPLVAVDEIVRFDRKAALRRGHDAALEAIFAWSERNLPNKLLYRRLLPMMQPAHAELVQAFRTTQGMKPDEAIAAADLLLMMTVDRAAENLSNDELPAAAPVSTDYTPRYAPAPAPGDLEKGRRYTSLHSALLNRAPPEVIADFQKYESNVPASSKGRGPAGDTALMAAVRTPETVRQLLTAGADPNGVNDWRKTALMTAAQTNQQASAQVLLDAGADIQHATICWRADGAGGPDNEEGAYAGRTALMYAAAGAGEPLLRLLLDRGAAIERRDVAGRTACDYLAGNKILTDAERSGIKTILCTPGSGYGSGTATNILTGIAVPCQTSPAPYPDAMAESQASQAPRAERYPEAKPGDRYSFVNGIYSLKCNRWEVKEVNQRGEVVSQCGDNTLYVTADSGNPVMIVNDRGVIVARFTPFLPALSFPLFVGKKWSGKYTSPQRGGIMVSGDMTCESAAFEEVTVAAGTFNAFRIECMTKWLAENTGFRDFRGTRKSTHWYAPAIGMTIRSVNEDSEWDTEFAGVGWR